MFLPKWLTFYLTSLPQNKLLRSFAFTSSRIVLREHFCTLKYIPIQQGTRVCLHGSQARVKSTDPGPNHHLHNNKIKKILTPFFAVFCSQNINRYTSIYTSQKVLCHRFFPSTVDVHALKHDVDPNPCWPWWWTRRWGRTRGSSRSASRCAPPTCCWCSGRRCACSPTCPQSSSRLNQ